MSDCLFRIYKGVRVNTDGGKGKGGMGTISHENSTRVILLCETHLNALILWDRSKKGGVSNYLVQHGDYTKDTEIFF